jgi:hypothetical protein
MGDFLHVILSEPPPGRPGGELWSAGAARWVRIAAPIMQKAVQDKAPIGQGDHAGKFKASITVRTATSTGNVQLKAGSAVPYAAYIRDGTRPHMIVPRSAKVLHFRTDAGASVFTARVNHPGTRANAFAKRGLEPRIPELQESFSLVMREIFGGTS